MSVKTHFVFPGQKSIFSLHWSQMVQMGPTGNSIYIYYIILYIIFIYLIQNSYIDLFRPFFTLLGHCGTLTSLSCLVIFGPKWVDPSHGLAFVAHCFFTFHPILECDWQRRKIQDCFWIWLCIEIFANHDCHFVFLVFQLPFWCPRQKDS